MKKDARWLKIKSENKHKRKRGAQVGFAELKETADANIGGTIISALIVGQQWAQYTRGVQKIRWLCGFLKKYLFIDQYLCCPLQSNPR